MPVRHLAFGGSLAVAHLVSAPRAAADAADRPASSLAAEAARLAEAGRWSDACPRWAESFRMDAQPETLARLADCEEHAGRTASAWAHWGELEREANGLDAPLTATAAARARAIDPLVPRLVVVVPAGRAGALTVRRDGAPVPRAIWGVAVPVDPGPHRVEFAAPGSPVRAVEVAIPATGGVTTVVAPDDAGEAGPVVEVTAGPLPPLPARAEPPAASKGAWRGPPPATIGLGIGGGASLVVAGVLGWRARATLADDEARCDASGGRVCDSTDAQWLGRAATGAAVVGAAALAAGAIVWIATPSTKAQVAVRGARLVVRVEL